jgi:ribosomal protein S18 acetylase RimI-like enzyme
MSGAGVVWRMRVPLEGDALGSPCWPEGVAVRTFTPADAGAVHALLVHGYRQGGGSVAEFDAWLPAMLGDSEYDPRFWFLAAAGETLAGVALCWTSAFVKDLVVHESWRGRGLGEALLRLVFTAFARRAATAVELKVDGTNAAAIRLYERAGMRAVEKARS